MLDLNVIVEVDDKTIRVGDIMDIDDTDLSNEFAAQAALYAHFAVLTAEAESMYDNLKEGRERTEADTYMYFKNDADSIPKGSRTVSDGTADKLVMDDANVHEAIDQELDAKRKWHILKAMTKSLEMRAQMLQSMGAHLRHEADMTGMHTPERSDPTSDNLRKRMHAKGLMKGLGDDEGIPF